MKPPQPAARSISGRLSFSLVFIVFIVVAVILAVAFAIHAANLKTALDDRAREYLSRIGEVLVLPIWNYDDAQIERIGTIFTENESVHSLRVEDHRGKALFEARKPQDGAPKIMKSDEILFEGRAIGRITLEVTQARYLLHFRFLLIGTLFTLLAALGVMASATRGLLTKFLQRPLASLEMGMDRLAAGDFSHRIEPAFRELSGIIKRFEEMAEQVRRREEVLRENEVRLTELLGNLRESEEKYRLLFEVGPDALIFLDVDSLSIQDCNRATEQLYGYSRDELMAMSPVDLSAEPEATRRTIREEQDARIPKRLHRRKDGSVFPVEISFSKLFSDGRHLMFAAIRDITERVRAEEALRDSEKKYRTLFERAGDAIFLVEPQTHQIMDCNERAAELEGYSVEELKGMKAWELYPVEERAVRSAGIDSLEPEGEAISLTGLHHRRKDGGLVPVEVNACMVEIGGHPVILALVRDVTERERAERTLRMTQFAVDRSRDAAFWMTADGKFVYVNDSASAILGYSREELLRMAVHDIDLQYSVELWPARWEELRRRGSFVFESVNQRKDGTIFPVEISVNLLTFEGEEINCAFSRDISERKRAEEELHQKEQQLARTNYLLELVLNTIPVRIFWKDLDSRYLGCNAAFAHDAGLTSVRDVIGRTDEEMAWREQAELYRADDVLVMRTGMPKLNYEEPQTTPDGGTIWLLTSKIPLRNLDGTIFGLLGVYEDITERKRAHEALQRANLVLENSPVMLFRWRAAPGWPVELVSENVRQLGYRPEELLSGEIPFSSLVYERDLARVGREVKDYTESGVDRFEQQYRVICRDGRVRWVDDRTFVERDKTGQVTHYQGIVMDITERRQAEEALRESETKFRALFENMPSGLALHRVILDAGLNLADYRILDVNPAYEKHTGIPATQAVGALASEVYGTGTAPYLDQFGEVAMTGRAIVFETYFEPLQKHFQMSAFSPQMGLFATIFEDITDRKRSEEELRQKNEEMERFVYTISHDLKSPLVTIQAFLRFLEKDLRNLDHERVRKDMDYIGNAATRMNRLLEELLQLSRIGRKVNPHEEVLLQDVVRDALRLVAGRIAEGGIHVELTPEPILLHGDRMRLVEVFQNLLDNAAKFARGQVSPTIWIGTEHGETGVILYVKDNGIGVDPRHLGKLFGLFEKLDPSSEGTGVGLALVKRIIEVHGGRIWVDSDGPGLGTVFRFTLPNTRRVKVG